MIARITALTISAFVLPLSVQAATPFDAVRIAGFNNGLAIAATVYLRDCTEPVAGHITCESCGNQLLLDSSDRADVYADDNEQKLDGVPENPRLASSNTVDRHYSHYSSGEVSVERARGAKSFIKYLTGLFEQGNRWCAAKGGERHDVKNDIAAVAKGTK
ncbi:MAG: hypothetical protein GC166_06270 [Alphaproteobacteria bacterium]|nr:hypothetical protein [Alphaproteobacteria bacterium]